MMALIYFLYKPVLKLLREREEKIATGIRDAEAAAVFRAEAANEKAAILAAANVQANEVSARAKVHADLKAAEILTEAHQQATAVAEDALQRANVARQQLLKESEAEIAKLAILAAEKILQERAL